MKTSILALLAATALAPAFAFAQGQTSQPNAPAEQAGQARPITADEITGMSVYSSNGQEIGEVERVVLGQNNQVFAVVAFGEFLGLGGESRLLPLSRMTVQGDRIVVRATNQAEFRALQPYSTDMAGYREPEDDYQVRVAVAAAGQQRGQQTQEQGQDGSRILVQRGTPTIRVDQADPQVTVRQAQPRVTVNQAQPEIIVRQPQPTVRVDIPQPEIIVRMPEPDVNVALAQPQVQVNQPQPQVQVLQPRQQPQVQVDRAQPRVLVQRRADSEPEVQVQRAEGQPTVRYERAEPRVVVNQAQGQPNVRIERMGQEQSQAQAQSAQRQQQQQREAAAQAAQQNQSAQQRAAAAQSAQQDQAVQQRQARAESVYSDEQRRTVRERLNAGDVEATGAVDTDVRTQPVPISQIEDTNVYNARGEELGEVDRIIMTPQGRRFLVVGSGGFLGIGRDRVAFPMERFWLRGDRLVIRGVTEDDIEAMDDYRDTVDNFQRMPRNQQAELRVWE
jgi:sporulation protein YlmC with PRC-barrel domain